MPRPNKRMKLSSAYVSKEAGIPMLTGSTYEPYSVALAGSALAAYAQSRRAKTLIYTHYNGVAKYD